jgi:type VI protein secretion system component Hcp
MAIPAYMEVEGIQGSVTVAGREGTVEILEFNHRVYLPTDRDTGLDHGYPQARTPDHPQGLRQELRACSTSA